MQDWSKVLPVWHARMSGGLTRFNPPHGTQQASDQTWQAAGLDGAEEAPT